MIRFLIIWLAASMMCTAATLEVPGTYGTVQAALDAAAAGDVINIAAGTYAERPTTAVAGTSGSRITVQASGSVTMLGIVLNHAYYDVTGITFAGWTTNNVNNACVDLGDNGDNARIINCQIRDGVKIKGTDIVFNDANPDTITSATGGFTAAGFAAGQTVQVYRGESGDTPLNNGQAFLIASVTDNTITLDAGASVTADTADTVYLSASIGYGIQAGTGVDGLVVRGCTFENLGADCQYIIGTNWIVEDCLFTDTGGFDILNYSGTNGIWRRNIVRDCPWEVYDPSPDVWDNWSAVQASNIVFEFNWIDSFDGVIGYNKGDGDGSGVIYRYNSFSNIPGILIVEMDNVTVEHNTFYAVGSTQSTVSPEFKRHPLEFDGTQTSRTGIVVKNNAFIGCGRQDSATNTSGWYTTNGTVAIEADYNLITGTSASSWEAKPSVAETNGINGGDPVLVNAADPDGADNIAFSSDDGLEPNTGSPLLDAADDGYEVGAYMDNANYFISIYGNNANAGTVRAPWATLTYAETQANAGETMVAMSGDYGAENVVMDVAGTSMSRLTFRSVGRAKSKRFEFAADYITIDGFELTGDFTSAPNYSVSVFASADYGIIKNLYIHDTTPLGFRAAAILFAPGNNGDGTDSPQGWQIINNRIERPGFHSFIIEGIGHTISGNTVIDAGGDVFRVFGQNHVITRNFARGTRMGTNQHPDFFQTFGSSGTSRNGKWAKNILIEENMVYNLYVTATVNVTFTNAGAQDTITRSSGSWIADGFESSKYIRIFGTGSNNGDYSVWSVTDTTLTLSSEDSLVNETASNAMFHGLAEMQVCQMDDGHANTSGIVFNRNVFYNAMGAANLVGVTATFTNNTFYNGAWNVGHIGAASPRQAEGCLYIKDTPSDGDTVTLATTTYTFRTVADEAGEIAIGAGLDEARYNFHRALHGLDGLNADHPTIHNDRSEWSTNTTYAQNYMILATSLSGDAGNGQALTETFTSPNNFFSYKRDTSTVSTDMPATEMAYGYKTTEVWKNNIFFACGNSESPTDPARGWYQITYRTTGQSIATMNYNYVGNRDYSNKNIGTVGNTDNQKFYEANGINGGNPLFVDASDPLGPDGLIFTADDGLQLQAGSPLLGAGEGGADIGAYGEGAPAVTGNISAGTVNADAVTIQ